MREFRILWRSEALADVARQLGRRSGLGGFWHGSVTYAVLWTCTCFAVALGTALSATFPPVALLDLLSLETALNAFLAANFVFAAFWTAVLLYVRLRLASLTAKVLQNKRAGHGYAWGIASFFFGWPVTGLAAAMTPAPAADS